MEEKSFFSGAEIPWGDLADGLFYGLEAALRSYCIAVRTVAPLQCERPRKAFG